MSLQPIPSRLYWACRRGMLELDLWLVYFLNNTWPNIDQDSQAIFESMLEEPDPVLYAWLTAQSIPEDPRVHSIVKLIRQYARH